MYTFLHIYILYTYIHITILVRTFFFLHLYISPYVCAHFFTYMHISDKHISWPPHPMIYLQLLLCVLLLWSLPPHDLIVCFTNSFNLFWVRKGCHKLIIPMCVDWIILANFRQEQKKLKNMQKPGLCNHGQSQAGIRSFVSVFSAFFFFSIFQFFL